MCGRIIQATGPMNLAIVDVRDVRDHRLDNFPRRYNGAPSQELLVIRQNHKTGERTLEPLRWGLDPLLVQGPKRRPSPHHKSKARSSTASLVAPLISQVNSGTPAVELKSGTYSGRPDA